MRFAHPKGSELWYVLDVSLQWRDRASTYDADSRTAHLRVASRLGAVHISGDLPSEAAPAVARVHNNVQNNMTVLPAPTARAAGWQQPADG